MDENISNSTITTTQPTDEPQSNGGDPTPIIEDHVDESQSIQKRPLDESPSKPPKKQKLDAIQRQEEKAKREEEKRKKMEERKQKMEQRETEKKQREEERKKKEEEKKAKNDAKEAERKKKEEERIKKEEEKLKLERKQKSIAAFLTKEKKPEPKPQVERVSNFKFPGCYFEQDVIIAPLQNVKHYSAEEIDLQIQKGYDLDQSIKDLKAKLNQKRKIHHIGEKRIPLTKLKNEIEEIPTVPMKKIRMKYLRFHENHRPSFYGSLVKIPEKIFRNPLHKYNFIADYENESDDEWEDEEGEELGNSDDDKEKESEPVEVEAEEEEDEFLVPDGYLSEDEGADAEGSKMDVLQPTDGETIPPVNSEKSQERKKALKEKSKKEMLQKMQPLRPTILGPFLDPPASESHLLARYKMEFLVALPIDAEAPPEKPMIAPELPTTPKKKEFPEADLIELVKILNGNPHGLGKITTEFHETRTHLSKAQIERKIKEIAVKENRKASRQYWYVKSELLVKYGLPEFEPVITSPQKQMISPQKQLISPQKTIMPPSPIKSFSNVLPQTTNQQPTPTKTPTPVNPSTPISPAIVNKQPSTPETFYVPVKKKPQPMPPLTPDGETTHA